MTRATDDPRAVLDAISEYPIFLAHNANVDALVHVDTDVERLLEAPGASWPESVDSPQALATTHDGYGVAAHANRVVEDPVSTVGLGDSIAVTNFLLENALADSA